MVRLNAGGGSTGIDELTFGVITISPNPSTDVFNFSFNKEIAGKTTLRVMNLAGQLIEMVELGEFAHTMTVAIDARNWATGIYLLQLTNNGTTSKDIKVMKVMKE
jgi:hypothetical protein